ncbi:hypothetical protein BC827DRAFT_834285 [Russula dissimulans]|nr:hypothetical protein BC827DRAFT_834285 [Russula dissimulans]
MPPQTHNTTVYHPRHAGDAAAVMREEARTAQFHRWSSRDSDIPRGVVPEPEHRWWQRDGRDHKFWIHDSPPSSASQDGTSNAGSEGRSSTAGSAEGPTAEERRGRTVSPYGSFFAEEMEFDHSGPPADVDTVLSNMDGAFQHRARTRRILVPPPSSSSQSGWTNPRRAPVPVAVAPMGPALFVAAGYPAYARPPVAVPAPDREAAARMAAETPLSPLSLAENSRRSQPPVSWRQGHYFEHPNSPCWHYSQCEPPQAATASPPGRSLSHDRRGRQVRGMASGRRRK